MIVPDAQPFRQLQSSMPTIFSLEPSFLTRHLRFTDLKTVSLPAGKARLRRSLAVGRPPAA